MVKCVCIIAAVVILPTALSFITNVGKHVHNHDGIHSYTFEFETSDGSYRKEEGGIVTGAKGNGLVVRGEFGYIDPEGVRHTTKYVADSNGYRPHINDDETIFNDRRIL